MASDNVHYVGGQGTWASTVPDLVCLTTYGRYSHQPPSVTRNQIFPVFSPNSGAMNLTLVPNSTYCSYTSFAALSVSFPKDMHVSWSKHFARAPNLTVTPESNSPIVALLWSSSVRRPFHLPKVVLEIIYTKYIQNAVPRHGRKEM